MKNSKLFAGMFLAATLAAFIPFGRAGDTNVVKAATDAVAKPKPDLLTTCPVSGEKLGEMSKPYVFIYKGQEVKLCCPDCRADFMKNPSKYLKKIQDAAAKPKN